MDADKRGWLIVLLPALVAGCLEFGRNVSTTTPSAQDVAGCRRVMYLDPAVVITPQGFKLTSGIDDAIWFKFVAQAKSIDAVFQSDVVDTTSFKPGFSFRGKNAGMPKWWDVTDKQLIGEGSIELPNVKFMNVGYIDNGDGTLGVYVMWHEV